MSEGPDIARLAALIGDPARANILLALLSVPALTAGELAREAGVSAQTASGHLRALFSEGLLTVTPAGRHRYYSLANEHVGAALEHLLGAAAALGFSRFKPGPRNLEQRRARTCYDHMAGEIAVGLFQRMLDRSILSSAGGPLRLTASGREELLALGLSDTAVDGTGRTVCRSCLDWSERRPHLAGRAGAALLQRFIALNWVERRGRTLHVTTAGDVGFGLLFAGEAMG